MEAEDTAQECFIALSTVETVPKTPLGAWLHRVATNRSLKHIRTRTRRSSYESKFSRGQADSTRIEWKDIEGLLDQAVDELPEKLRGPVVAHFWEGESYTSIAKATGASRQTVTYRVETAVKRIRKALKKRGVSTAGSTVATMMATNLAQAATVPTTLTASLAKIAVVGMVNTTNVGAGSVGTTLLGGIVMAKSKVIGIGVVLALLIGLIVLNGIDDDTTPDDRTRASQPVSSIEPTEADPKRGESLVAKPPGEPENPPVVVVEDEEAEDGQDDEESDVDGKPSSVQGHVANESGQLVAGADVVVMVMQSSEFTGRERQYRAVTDDNGAFSIEGIRGNGWAWAMASIDGASGMQTFDIRAPHDFDGILVTINSGFSLAGRVLSHDGRPVSGAIVGCMLWVGDNQEGGGDEFAVSDAEGYFELFFPEFGVASLLVESKEGRGVFDGIKIGTQKTNDFRLEEQGSLSGEITLHDGTPAQNIEVRIRTELAWDSPSSSVPRKMHRDYSAETTAEGYYTMPYVQPGQDYLIHVRSTNLSSGMYIRRMDIGSIAPGEDRIWDYAFDEFLVVTGRILGQPSGRPISDATALLLDVDFNDGQAYADDNGQFTLRYRGQPGTYSIAPSFQSVGGHTTPAGEVTTIQLNYDKPAEVELHLDDPYTRTFRFVDGFGQPVAGVEAMTFWTGQQGERSGKDGRIFLGPTKEDGLVRYDGFSPIGEYILASRVQRSEWQRSLPFDGEPGVEYPRMDIVISRLAGIEGIAKTVDGKPIQNQLLMVNVFREEKQLTQFRIQTRDDGYFFAENQVPATTVTLTLSNSNDEQWSSEPIDFPADLITDLGVLEFGRTNQTPGE
jgi:RNA polymerase sigma factor (sigma-70 family)